MDRSVYKYDLCCIYVMYIHQVTQHQINIKLCGQIGVIVRHQFDANRWHQFDVDIWHHKNFHFGPMVDGQLTSTVDIILTFFVYWANTELKVTMAYINVRLSFCHHPLGGDVLHLHTHDISIGLMTEWQELTRRWFIGIRRRNAWTRTMLKTVTEIKDDYK